MKTIKELMKAKKDKAKGNHSVVINGNHRRFYYYVTPIVVVDDEKRVFTTNNGGWGTSSTTRAINAYKKELKEKDYREVG